MIIFDYKQKRFGYNFSVGFLACVSSFLMTNPHLLDCDFDFQMNKKEVITIFYKTTGFKVILLELYIKTL